ncbi:hypothetical protein SAMN05444397_104205 [Flavobacterium aquidurense]|uniref:Tetratricopeptide repeat-containing protein n=1 Tax=Flavobacterium frigidimaris TaxID=262320 RepID=A0ABX4BRN3_FLAFR|nr:tetratricopeptide repeat protein [Flavobacterium frigidimaris]OXA79526.1 hypothetical protein B0A65_09135 [Flavobacterium frigidimaris]SDZ21780.1 hypothetical protein SAMN05444397_104205 [Flavobacterium aquidurense]
MNVTDYTYLMNKPDAITEKQAEALGNVLNEFPYFQSARALRLKGLYNQNSFKYNFALKVTAAHTTDRTVLFDFITSETFTSIQGEYYDKKLQDLLNITVFDSEIVLAEEKKKLAEVRVDPIEQSILNSIKEATGVTFEDPSKIEENLIDPVIEEPSLDSFREPTNDTVEVPLTIEENSVDAVTEEPILDSFTEATNVTFEEPVKIEYKPIDTIIPTLDSFEEVVTITAEEPVEVEENPIETVTEQAILDSFKEVTAVTLEESLEVEEKIIEAIIEQPTLDSFEEVAPTTFEEPLKVDEKPIELVIEEPTLDSFEEATPTIEDTPIIETNPIIETTPIIKEPTPTFFDEIVEEEIPSIRVEPIEESTYNSLQEATTVVFEEVPVIDEPQASEEPEEIEVSETVKTAEENLEIGKPLDFSANEKHSFQEWLQLAKTEPIDRTKDAPEEAESIEKVENTIENVTESETIDEEKKKKAEIINKFIEANPKISPIRQTAITPAVQLDSDKEENSYLMTETLARVYLEQKKYTKAIQAYEILILKYPEKISFFADRISDIKILQQNNNNN